jgi:hypothetical protein
VGVRRDQQLGAGHAPLGEPVDLVEQHLRVDHDTVADDRDTPGREHARRQQVQRVLTAVRRHHGVPGVVAALVTDHVVDPLAEQVGNLAFALVAPLGADEHDRWHGHRLQGAG